LIVEALEKMKGPITRAGLLSTIKEVGAFDLGGIRGVATFAGITGRGCERGTDAHPDRPSAPLGRDERTAAPVS
jgi:hypothetical protein